MAFPKFVKTKTLTKAQLVQLLNGLADEANVYLMLDRSVLEMALHGAPDPEQELYFGLSSSSQHEADGVSLLAEILPKLE
jgi:hypothetical protein